MVVSTVQNNGFFEANFEKSLNTVVDPRDVESETLLTLN